MYGVGKHLAYSQNLIQSPSVVKRLLGQSTLFGDDLVLEIGAGKGVITEALSLYCKRVIAYEIDPSFYRFLSTRFANRQNIDLINKDFLEASLPDTKYKVFSNIPFFYTSRILRKLLWSENPPVVSYLIIQREAAEKYCGEPRETQMSLLLKPVYIASIIDSLNPSDFYPKPKVISVFIKIEKREMPDVSVDLYFAWCDFIVYATTRWKVTIKRTLNKVFTYKQLKRLSKSLGFGLESLPLDLSYEQWFGLFRYYVVGVELMKKQCVSGSYQRQLESQGRLEKKYRSRRY